MCVLQNRLAGGDAVSAWAALRAAPTVRDPEQVYQLARTYFHKENASLLYFTKNSPQMLVSTLRQEKGVKGENELPQRISVLN